MGASYGSAESQSDDLYVAKASGVSSSAVSYALNGKPGVSRCHAREGAAGARKLGCVRTARHSRSRSRARAESASCSATIHSCFPRNPTSCASSPGLGSALEERDYSLLVRMSMDDDDEVSILEDWIATGNVDALLLLNLEIGDAHRADEEQSADAVPRAWRIRR